MMIFPFVSAALLATALISLAPKASAATIELGGDTSLGCFATLSGPIELGDADRLHQFLQDTYSAHRGEVLAGVKISPLYADYAEPERICLNSPGGSLAEATRMADILLGARDDENSRLTGIGTAIPSGAECASACAVFFLSGGKFISAHHGRRPDRILHINGALGFHAPGLTVAEDVYDKSRVEKAFRLALASIAAVHERQNLLRMRQSLMQWMLETPPEEMRYITTIGQAAEWNIGLAGVPKLAELSPHNLVQSCFNLRRAVRPDASNLVDGTTLSNHVDKSSFGLKVYNHKGFPDGDFEITEVTAGRMARLDRADGRVDFETEPHPDMDFVSCQGSLDATGGWGSTTEVQAEDVDLPAWYAFPPNLFLSDLARLAGTNGTIAAEVILDQNQRLTQKSRCKVFDRAGRKSDDEACTLDLIDVVPASLMIRRLWQFTWPSGSQTILAAGAGWNTEDGTRDYPMAINGSLADMVRAPDGQEGLCLQSHATGNTFCYQP